MIRIDQECRVDQPRMAHDPRFGYAMFIVLTWQHNEHSCARELRVCNMTQGLWKLIAIRSRYHLYCHIGVELQIHV